MQIFLAPDRKCRVFPPVRNAWRYLMPFSSAILSPKNGYNFYRFGVVVRLRKGQCVRIYSCKIDILHEKEKETLNRRKKCFQVLWVNWKIIYLVCRKFIFLFVVLKDYKCELNSFWYFNSASFFLQANDILCLNKYWFFLKTSAFSFYELLSHLYIHSWYIWITMNWFIYESSLFRLTSDYFKQL